MYLRLLVLLLVCSTHSNAQQTNKDLIDEFNKVMAFASKPVVSYQSITQLSSIPVIQKEDTMNTREVFYKSNNNVYTQNGKKETYLQDSLYIQVDNVKRTIEIDRVDIATKANLNISPLATKDLQKKIANNYTFKKALIDKDKNIAELAITPIPDTVNKYQPTSFSFLLRYNTVTWLPEMMETVVTLKQYITADLAQEVSNRGIKTEGLIQQEGDDKFYVHKQILKVAFTNINTSEVKEMPLWQQFFMYDKSREEFVGIGKYKDYTITQTF